MGSVVFWALLVAFVAETAVTVAAAVTPPSLALGTLCQSDKLELYTVVMHTFWTRDKFPKHYPDWRPTAQFSKIIGASHDGSWSLFNVGRSVSPEVKEFAETGRWETDRGQGSGGVLDQFTAPPVAQGQGRTEAQFFLDGNHSRVSLMSRIIPSPDWFVGLDSFQLCVDGSWLDTITIEVDPLDAGTDNGFTFTAPNWTTEPQGVVYRITSRFPAHPAGSFYYPYMKRLPPIATFQFIKLKEFEIGETYHHSEDEKSYEIVKSDMNSINALRGNDIIQEEIEEEVKEQELFMKQQTTMINDHFPVSPTRATMSGGELESSNVKQAEVASTYNNGIGIHHHQRIGLNKLKHKKSKIARDCKVGEWGQWSVCSSSCGVGEMSRVRSVIRTSSHSGAPCPPLRQVRWCGSPNASNCSVVW